MNQFNVTCDIINGPNSISIYHVGPPLELGPLPTFFYFALSGEESLTLNPYNQPVSFLRNSSIRIFSLTLPGHHPHQNKFDAMHYWSTRLSKGNELLHHFIDEFQSVLEFLIASGYIDTDKIGVGGLSRGGFIATHIAAREKRIKVVLGFSPLTDLSHLIEFQNFTQDSKLLELSLISLVDTLADKKFHFFIGNRDIRVGTRACFNFIEALSEASYAHGHRSPPIECTLYPSIGHKGHGTPPEIFQNGVNWLKKVFNL